MNDRQKYFDKFAYKNMLSSRNIDCSFIVSLLILVHLVLFECKFHAQISHKSKYKKISKNQIMHAVSRENVLKTIYGAMPKYYIHPTKLIKKD